MPFEDVLIELGPDGASAAYFVMDEHVMTWLLNDPYVAVSSDGSPTMLHPRGHGSFAKVIAQYVVAEGLLPLEGAVRKMSGLTAEIFRLDDSTVVGVPRGRLAPGFAADLVAFDPAEVRAPASFEEPHRKARGMRAVWVNGRLAWADGGPAGEADRGGGVALRALR